ncbi:MAG TPA: response regulator [Steroidobacteraceae bacterium]|nr:response regulator [Steroidobacteraceae bacterium]
MASKIPPVAEDELQAGLRIVSAERDRLAELLRERERDRKYFFATLAHEMRNPLAAMRSAVHVLGVADNDHALSRAARGMIERQVTQLTRLIDDLADVTQIAEGQLELSCERVSLESLLHRAIDTNRAVLESRQQHLRLELPPSTVWLHVDGRRMVQVFAGILNNSSKFSDLGTEIRIRAVQEDPWLTVAVSDQGAGISADLLPQVFDMFTRSGHGIRGAHMGLGIGMTLAKNLVELHGGRISARSDGPGRGSTFEVQLNLQIPALRAAPNDAQAMTTAAERGSARILIVDDNRDGAQGLALMLDLEGHDVRTAADGLEALEIAEKFRPHVVLLDIGMPGIDGYETARRLRALPWGESVLLCAQTGWGQEDDKRRARKAGFDRHLVKPVDPDELNRILAEVCHPAPRPVRPGA